jgi:lipoprotein-anchoring transpeptidase ErfK/SrfK
MGRKAQIAIVVVVVALIGAAVGAYAYDASKKDQIADGIRIGHVDVGGLDRDQAVKRVHKQLVAPLAKPVTVTYHGTKYILSPEQLNVRANVEGMVDSAVDASRDGGLPTRLWRDVSGGEVDKTITPSVTYNRDALDEFISKVQADVNTEPQDASIDPTGGSLNPVPGKTGVTLRADELRRQLEAAVEDPDHRTLAAQADKVKPDVTTDELASKYPTYLTVDRANFELTLWKDLKAVKTYPIAVGQQGLETPAGQYTINDKQVNPSWHVPDSAWAGDLAGKVIPPGPEDPLKARWMGFYNGAGVHGTDDVASLGSAASHGCVRMSIPDVIELYDQVPLGTPIYIG